MAGRVSRFVVGGALALAGAAVFLYVARTSVTHRDVDVAPSARTSSDAALDTGRSTSDSASALLEDTQRPAGTGTIRGVVVAPGNAGDVRPITVSLQAAAETPGDVSDPRVIQTGADQRFEFGDLSAGGYMLVASTRNHAATRTVVLESDTSEREIHVTLAPAGTISGRVVNGRGEPVAGADVYKASWIAARQRLTTTPADALASRATTDADGRFEIGGLRLSSGGEPGYRLAVLAEDYAAYLSDHISTGSRDVELVLATGISVTGRLLDDRTGTPLPNKAVEVRSDAVVDVQSVPTDEDGYFFLADARAGEYHAVIHDDDLILTAATENFAVSNSLEQPEIVLRAVRGGTMSGRVVDRDTGRGVPGIEVEIGPRTDDEFEAVETLNTQTGPDGSYVFKRLTPSVRAVELTSYRGYRHLTTSPRKFLTVDVGLDVTGIDFELASGLHIRGRVEDESGRPLGGVIVSAEATIHSDWTRSASDGTFVLGGFQQDDEVSIAARDDGLAAVSTEPPKLTIGAEDVKNVRVIMGQGASLEATVVDPSGRPQSGVIVALVGEMHSGGGSAPSTLEGAIEINGIPPDNYRAFPMGRGVEVPEELWQKISIAPGEQKAGVRIVIPGLGPLAISGRVVTSTGAAVPYARVSASTLNNAGAEPVEADAAGRFSLRGLHPGEYFVSATAYGFDRSASHAAMAGSSNVDLVLESLGGFEGRVVNARTGQPVTAYEISASTGRSFYGSHEFKSVHDAEGRFELDLIQSGKPIVDVRAPGYAESRFDIGDVAAGQVLRGITLRLPEAVSLTGSVSDMEGERLSAATVTVYELDAAWPEIERANTLTRADGMFKFDALSAGNVRVVARHDDKGGQAVVIKLVPRADNFVEIVLGGGGVIEGTVSLNGVAPAEAYVWANMHEQGLGSRGSNVVDGQYRLDQLPVGTAELNLTVRAPGQPEWYLVTTIEVADDAAASHDFVLADGPYTLEGRLLTEHGQPLGGGWVIAQWDDGETSYRLGDVSSDKGEYEIHGIRVPEVTITAHLLEEPIERVALIAGQAVLLDITTNPR